jgi:hypothetical protein
MAMGKPVPISADNRAALIALLDAITEPVTVTVHGTRFHATFELRPQPQIYPGTLRNDIYRALEENETRQTLNQILDTLQAYGREASGRTVERELEVMRNDSLIDNDRQGRPPGSGLCSRMYGGKGGES